MAQSPPASPNGRDKILDAAETLFASESYHGVSMREIARAAGVELGLLPYHFGNKDELFRQVIMRRAPDLALSLGASLKAVQEGLAPTEAVHQLLRAYVAPHLERLAANEPGWRSYMRLAAQASLVIKRSDLTRTAAVEYEPVLRNFENALIAVLPDADPKAVSRRFSIFVTSVLGVVVNVPEVQPICGDGHEEEMNLADTLVDIFAAGFLAIDDRLDNRRR